MSARKYLLACAVLSVIGLMAGATLVGCATPTPEPTPTEVPATPTPEATPVPTETPAPAPPEAQDVKVWMESDTYVQPAGEMAGTFDEPDIIYMENEYVKIGVIPQAGRQLTSYIFKPTGNEQFWVKYEDIMPLMWPGIGYVIDQGGYFLSRPWNGRDRIPIGMEYEIKEEGPDVGRVRLFAEDPDHLIMGEVWITLERGSALAKVEVKLSNDTGSVVNDFFRDYTEMAPGGEVGPNVELSIPVDEVEIGRSKDGWMGAEGEKVAWPAPWAKMENWEHDGVFWMPADSLSMPFMAAANRDTGDTFIKIWGPADFWERIRVWSYGVAAEKVRAAHRAVSMDGYMEDMALADGDALEFTTYFYALPEALRLDAADARFAAGFALEKDTYAADEELKASLTLGASRVYEGLTLKVAVVDGSGSSVAELGSIEVAAVAPSVPYRGAWVGTAADWGLSEGEYSLSLQVVDASGEVMFEALSGSFVVQ